MQSTTTYEDSQANAALATDLSTHGVVVTCPRGKSENPQSHECVTRAAIAAKLAALKGFEFGGEHDERSCYDGAIYFVPGDTLTQEVASALGIRGDDDLFGGVVPQPFVGTKSITHGLARLDAVAPPGWSEAFAEEVRHAVLPGYSAFSRKDAMDAGERLLASGAVRVKPACAIGGRGQIVAPDMDTLHHAVHLLDVSELAEYGVTVEQNLSDVVTYSVGQVRVGGVVATYFGSQKLARDAHGLSVYGGSALTVVRGDFEVLLGLDVDRDARVAIEQARIYDDAARRCFAGFFASRRNYDVARGTDREGCTRSGVLEQSWRLGGASGAEIAALEAFRADPDLAAVRAEGTEVYGAQAEPPPHATVYFRGFDQEVGYITKYTTLEPYVHA